MHREICLSAIACHFDMYIWQIRYCAAFLAYRQQVFPRTPDINFLISGKSLICLTFFMGSRRWVSRWYQLFVEAFPYCCYQFFLFVSIFRSSHTSNDIYIVFSSGGFILMSLGLTLNCCFWNDELTAVFWPDPARVIREISPFQSGEHFTFSFDWFHPRLSSPCPCRVVQEKWWSYAH